MVGKLTPDNMMSASLIPAMLGLSPYKSQNELLKTFVDLDAGIPPHAWEGNELTWWGNELEPLVLREAAKRLQLDQLNTEHTEAYYHPELPIACSLDGDAVGTCEVEHNPARGIYLQAGDAYNLAGKRVIIEAKTTQAAPEDQPPAWRGPMQLQAQMMVTGADYGVVAVLYRGSELRCFVYPVVNILRSQILDGLLEFERRRRDIDWYPVLSSEDGNVAYSNVDDGAPPLDIDSAGPDVAEAFEALVEAKRLKKECEQAIDAAEAALKEWMGNHEEATGVADGVTYKLRWPMRNVKAQPAKQVPAKPAQKVRQNALTIKEMR